MRDRILQLLELGLDVHELELQLAVPALESLVVFGHLGGALVEAARPERVKFSPHLLVLLHQVKHILQLLLQAFILFVHLVILRHSEPLFQLVLV